MNLRWKAKRSSALKQLQNPKVQTSLLRARRCGLRAQGVGCGVLPRKEGRECRAAGQEPRTNAGERLMVSFLWLILVRQMFPYPSYSRGLTVFKIGNFFKELNFNWKKEKNDRSFHNHNHPTTKQRNLPRPQRECLCHPHPHPLTWRKPVRQC